MNNSIPLLFINNIYSVNFISSFCLYKHYKIYVQHGEAHHFLQHLTLL